LSAAIDILLDESSACRAHPERRGLRRSTVHGVVFAFVLSGPRRCSAHEVRRFDSALQRERPRRRLGLVDIPSQFLRGATAVNAPRFSALADVLTFLRLSFRPTQNFASRLAKENNAQP
jgi:hypothetical protein